MSVIGGAEEVYQDMCPCELGTTGEETLNDIRKAEDCLIMDWLVTRDAPMVDKAVNLRNAFFQVHLVLFAFGALLSEKHALFLIYRGAQPRYTGRKMAKYGWQKIHCKICRRANVSILRETLYELGNLSRCYWPSRCCKLEYKTCSYLTSLFTAKGK